MSDNSSNQWTHPPGYRGATWNPLVGCNVFTGRINFDEAALQIPLKARKPTCYFVNSMSDLFHEAVPDDFVRHVLDICVQCCYQQGHIFQILTKRADRMREFVLRYIDDGHLCGAGPFHPEMHDGIRHEMPQGIWLGVSVEDQQRADERIPLLLQTPAAVRFLSCEPLLGAIDLTEVTSGPDAGIGWTYRHWDALTAENWCDCCDYIHPCGSDPINWVIVGGESGHGARPCNLAWVRSIIKQCQAAAVPVFVKQLGTTPAGSGTTPTGDSCFTPPVDSNGLPLVIKHHKGGDPAEWPSDLRVRQFPQPAEARR